MKPYKQTAIKKHFVPLVYGSTPDGNPFKVLTAPSKLPCPSFSLPAGDACPYMVTEPATDGSEAICGDCYACKGFYQMTNVHDSQHARFAWVRQSMKTPAGVAEFINATVAAIRATATAYFRGHDSGDFFSPAYAMAWLEICKQLPEVKFWFPTRSYQDGLGAPNARMLPILRALNALPNVSIRPSALHFGHSAPVVDGLSAGSTSECSDAYQCPAPQQDNQCGDCRHCWQKDADSISYHRH